MKRERSTVRRAPEKATRGNARTEKKDDKVDGEKEGGKTKEGKKEEKEYKNTEGGDIAHM